MHMISTPDSLSMNEALDREIMRKFGSKPLLMAEIDDVMSGGKAIAISTNRMESYLIVNKDACIIYPSPTMSSILDGLKTTTAAITPDSDQLARMHEESKAGTECGSVEEFKAMIMDDQPHAETAIPCEGDLAMARCRRDLYGMRNIYHLFDRKTLAYLGRNEDGTASSGSLLHILKERVKAKFALKAKAF